MRPPGDEPAAYSAGVEMKPRILLFLPLLAVALVSFVIVRSQQGEGATLIARQRYAQALTPAAVARVVRVAPDPITNARGRRAACTPRGSGQLHNPWICTITYLSGRQIQYRVTISLNGSYSGDHQIVHYRGRTSTSLGEIKGCCVTVP